jgi:hypothetical protein
MQQRSRLPFYDGSLLLLYGKVVVDLIWPVRQDYVIGQNFLAGYTKHIHLDSYWVQQIPMFMDYRNICSFMWWLNSWDGDESHLSEAQHNYIVHAVKLIQNGQPFDGCDIQI